MSYSFTFSETRTFTVTHARHMAAKVVTDLKRMQRFYKSPSDTKIREYEAEIIEYLKAGYLGKVWFGFRRNDNWIEPTLCYTARDLDAAAANDDDPGRVRPRANVTGATFYSYMTYSAAFDELSQSEKDAFQEILPFTRSGAPEPGVSGYLRPDRTYSSGGRALDRASVRSY